MNTLSELEIALDGGNVNTSVVRVGDTVRRHMSPSSPAVHRLLLHLEASGFEASPRFLGIDEKNREILSYVEGETGVRPDLWQGDEALVAAAAGLLRRYHDATADFPLTDSDTWTFSDPNRHEVICHNDFAPYNFVFDAGLPIAIIDFDFDLAGPGPRLRDVAYAAYWMVPLAFSATEMQSHARSDLGDDGIGIPADPTNSKAGLGTGIFDAMAKQLDATFTLKNANPGTKAEIIHA